MSCPMSIWGLGSPHSDDRIGWYVAERLMADPCLQDSVRIAMTPWDLLDGTPRESRWILIDASRMDLAPGTVQQFDESDLTRFSSALRSTHGGSLKEVILLAKSLGYSFQELVLFTIEVEVCEPGDNLSEAARRGAGLVVEGVTKLSREWMLDR